MESIKVEYKGVEITYREESENWGCQIDDGNWHERQTLKECKKRIDDFFKKEHAFERFDAYLTSYSGVPRLVTVTSITEDRKDAWVSGSERREKASVGSLFAVNDVNNEIVKAIQDSLKQRKKLEEERKELLSNLVPITI